MWYCKCMPSTVVLETGTVCNGGDHHIIVTNSAGRLYLKFMHAMMSHCVWLC